MALNIQKYSTPNGKHLLIPILLTIVYFATSMIILNNNYKFFLLAPLLLTLLILKLLWDKSNHVLSLIFTISVVASLAILLTCSNRKQVSLELQLLYNRHQYTNDTNYQKFIYLTSSSQYNIFFIETNFEREEFSTKQLCAIESAARINPKGKVFVSSIKSEFSNMNLIREYSNLVWLKFKPLELFRDTPLWSWWLDGQVFTSEYMSAHISDAARIAFLYKHGGFYSDLDTISVKSFEALTYASGAGYLDENEPSLGNGFLHFTKKNPYLEFLMTELQSKYAPSYWGANGPTLLIETLKTFCNHDNIFELLMRENSAEQPTTHINQSKATTQFNKHRCNDLTIYPEVFFYPYTYKNGGVDNLFRKNGTINVSKIIDSYSIHFYGSLSNKFHVGIHDFSMYEYLASQHCPVIYEHVKKNFLKFE